MMGDQRSSWPSGGGSMSNDGYRGNRRQGDWDCPKCNNMNYASRDRCNGKDCDFEKKDLDDMACSYRFMGGAMGSPQGQGPAMGSMGQSFGSSPATLGGYGSPLRRPGDWDCPRCGNVNYGSRTKCNKGVCQLPKPDFSRSGGVQPRRGPDNKPGDWGCYKCGNVNYASRDSCNLCKASKEVATEWVPPAKEEDM